MIYAGLILELDGTVMRSDSKGIEPDELVAMQELIKLRIPVVIATGQTRYRVAETVKQLGVCESVILQYGSMLWSPVTGTVENTVPIPANAVRALYQWSQEHGITPYMLTSEGTVCSHDAERVPLFEPFLTEKIEDILEMEAGVLQVVLPVSRTEEVEALESALSGVAPECTIFQRGNHLVCINAGINKGLALKRLALERGWNLRKFVSLGIDKTDLPVFQEVGLGIAMGTDEALIRRSGYAYPADKTGLLSRCITECFAIGDFRRWGW